MRSILVLANLKGVSAKVTVRFISLDISQIFSATFNVDYIYYFKLINKNYYFCFLVNRSSV